MALTVFNMRDLFKPFVCFGCEVKSKNTDLIGVNKILSDRNSNLSVELGDKTLLLEKLNEELTLAVQRFSSCEDNSGKQVQEINNLKIQINDLIKQIPVVDPRLTALELKYPPVQTILYKGWNLNGKQVNVPVNDFITPNSFYVRKLVYESGVPKTEDAETAIPKLRKFYFDNVYSYMSDPNLYSLDERWDMPWEILARYYDLKTKGTGDCEGHAAVLKSIYNAWGLPDWKSRILCGNCNTGDGHATNTVLSEVTGQFHHINSTMGTFFNKISDFPTVDDGYAGKDAICGIKIPWFSYTYEKCYLGKFTTAAEEGFKNEGEMLFEIIS